MGKRAPLIIAAAVVLLLAGGALALYLYDSGRENRIAKGVTVAGVDVGGMSKTTATNLLQRRLAEPLGRPIVIVADHHRFHLSSERAGVSTDVGGMVAEAVAASRQGDIFQRSWRDLTGGKVNKQIALKLEYNDRAVRSLVRHIARRINRPPKDASVTPTSGGLQTVASRTGYSLQGNDLRHRIEHALVTPGASRRIVAHTRIEEPSVTTASLASRYPWYIVVDRPAFRLTVYEHLKQKKT